MNIRDLSRNKQLALVALVEAMVMSDGGVSEAETANIGQLASALGDDTYRDLLNEADSRFENTEALKTYLKGISEPEVRNLIYGLALQEVISAPTVNHAENALLQWLTETWNIEVKDAKSEA